MNFLKYLSVMALLTIAVIGGGCDRNQATGDETRAGQVTGDQAANVGSSKGDQAPDFTLRNLAGGDLTLSDLRGKTVILDFWDTWCPPCRRALPHLQELSTAYSQDVVVVGVAFGREGEAKVRSYIKSNGLTFPMVIYNPESTILADFGGIQSIPTTFLIDESGVIREKWVGGAEKSSYEKAVQAVVGGVANAG